MKRPIAFLLLALLCVGCLNPNAGGLDDKERRIGGGKVDTRKSVATTVRSPGLTGDTPGTPVPTPRRTPTLITTPTPQVSVEATATPFPGESGLVAPDFGDLDFQFVAEPPNSWSLRAFLNRPRAGLSVGVADGVMIAAEGDHRPSMEVWNPAIGNAWVLNTEADADFNTGGGETRRQGLSLSASGVFQDELWTAGGLRGQYSADGTSGRPEIAVYTKAGWATSRADEGTYSLTKPRRAATGGVVEGTFVIAGGMFKDTEVMATVERKNLKAPPPGASAGADMPLAVGGAASAVIGGKLYILGGFTIAGGKAEPTAAVQVYDLAGNSWVRDGQAGAPPPLPAALHSAAATAVDKVIYLAGGQGTGGEPVNTLYRLDTGKAGATWVQRPNMPTARALLALVPFQSAVWAIGGIGADRRPLRTVETYNP